jgi:uncharacterized membrane protein HdeD (DUF308 family)
MRLQAFNKKKKPKERAGGEGANMIAQSKPKITLWQLLLAILAVSFGLVFFTNEAFAVAVVVVIEAVLLLTLAALYFPHCLRWWRKR